MSKGVINVRRTAVRTSRGDIVSLGLDRISVCSRRRCFRHHATFGAMAYAPA